MTDDPVDRLRFIYKRDDSHPAATGGIDQWIHLVDLADHPGPALGRHITRLIFNDGAMRKISPSLTHLPPVGIGVSSSGSAVSVTYTWNGDFGAYFVSEGTGVFLNNSIPDFNSVVRAGGIGKANLVKPGKRPLSSMTPTIIAKDGKPVWNIGSPGGTTIIIN